jgi:hypothetical protein
MPEQSARKRLKKKMLDRWENEGGSIAAGPTGADETGPTGDYKGEGKRLSASQDSSTVATPAPRAKGGKSTRK